MKPKITHRILAPRTGDGDESLAVLAPAPRGPLREGLVTLPTFGGMSFPLQHPVVMCPGLLLEVGVPECGSTFDGEVLLTLLV